MHLAEHYDDPIEVTVSAEGALGKAGGKTTNGVTAHSTSLDVSAVVDSTTAGQAVKDVLGSESSDDVPIIATVETTSDEVNNAGVLILGVTPVRGDLPIDWVPQTRTAIGAGCNVISGLHDFLSDDPEWRERAASAGVSLVDVREPPEKKLRVADGWVDDCDADVVLTMGTDYTVSKRTTTFEIYHAACEGGLGAGWVVTGQTGMVIGADVGVAIDRVPADFVAETARDLVSKVAETHDIVFMEGQAALSHRTYSGVTLGLLHGSNPDVIIVAGDPDRVKHDDFDRFEIGGLQEEVEVIGHLLGAGVATISTWGDAAKVEDMVGIPTGNVLKDGGPEAIPHSVQEALWVRLVVWGLNPSTYH